MEILKLLCSQSAIALQNARLYEQLEDYSRTLEQKVEAALRRSEVKFRNLFENSQVGIFRTRSSDGLIFEVEDTGPGIAPEEIDILFVSV